MSADTPHGRIDRRFPRFHLRLHDTSLRSTPLHFVHRRNMVCARIFSWFESPSSVPSFPTPFTFSDGYVTGTLTSCMQISKPRLLGHNAFRVFGSAVKRK